MVVDRRTVLLFISAAGLVACGSDSSTSNTSVASVAATTTAPQTTTKPATPFRSDLYGYIVNSPDWDINPATEAWDGTGSPGNGDPTVDTLRGPEFRRAYALATPTTKTLDEYAAASRAAAHASPDHPCPAAPEATAPTTVAGETAILDEIHCPDAAGVFALNVYFVHSGQAYTVFTFDQPGKEAEMRTWFGELLQTIAFDA